MNMSKKWQIVLASVAGVIALIILYLMFSSGSTFLIVLALLLMAGGGAGGYLWWRRRAAERKAIEMEELSGDISRDDPRARILKLRMSFERGLKQFSSFGKGIYSLPWYVIVGEDGAGKTEAVRLSGLGFPPGLENGMLAGGGDGAALNWWFTSEAVILEVPGEWVLGGEEGDPLSEWTELCRLLAAHRPRMPLNGALLALPAEGLLGDSPEDTKAKAGQLARRLEQAQSALEIRFPVFVMVTKCDRVVGFREFFELTPEAERGQILGWSDPAKLGEAYDPKALEEQLGVVFNGLKSRQTELLSVIPVDPDTSAPRAGWADAVCAFPGGLAGVIPNLRTYLEAIFLLGEWSTRPLFLRGIYFSSARRKGPAIDLDVGSAFGLPVECPRAEDDGDDEDANAKDSYFLGDLFAEKVVVETGLVLRASSAGGFRSISKFLPWAFGLACTSLLIFMTLLSVSRLREEIGDEHVYWGAAARDSEWRAVAGRWSWKPALVPAEGRRFVYAGSGTLQVGDREFSAADFLGRIASRVEKPMQLPWTFRFTNKIEGDLSGRRLEAARALFESSVLYPVLTASVRKLAVQGADRWSPVATGALQQILLMQVQATAKDPPRDAEKLLDLDALFKYALESSPGDYERYAGNDSKVFAEVLRKLYGGKNAPWPPASLDVYGPSAREAVTKGVARFCASWAGQMGPNKMSRFFADIATLTEAGEEFLAAERALAELAGRSAEKGGFPESLAGHNKLVGEWERQFVRLGVARETIRSNQELLKAGKLQQKYVEIGATTYAAAEESLKSLKRATETVVEGGARVDEEGIVEFFADLDRKLGLQLDSIKRDFDEGKVREGLKRLDDTVFAPVAEATFSKDLPRAYERRHEIYALSHRALAVPTDVPGLLGLEAALGSMRDDIASAKASIQKRGKAGIPLVEAAAAASLAACGLAERGRAFLLIKAAFDSVREAPDGVGGMVVRRAAALDPERKPRISLTALQGGEFDKKYSRAVAKELLAERGAARSLLAAETAEQDVLELAELRKEQVEFGRRLNRYLADYLGYWAGLVETGIAVRAPAGAQFFNRLSEVKAWQINDGLKGVMTAAEAALTGFKGVGDEVLAGRVESALRRIQTGRQSLGGAQLLEECKKILGKWSAAGTKPIAVRGAILAMQPGDFFQEYLVSWGSADADVVLAFWEDLALQAIVRLSDVFQAGAAREHPRLAELEAFPLALPGVRTLSEEQVAEAYQVFRRVGADASKLPAGAIGKGGRTGKAGLDKALDRLVVAELPQDMRAWFAGADKVLAALPDRKSLECEVALPSVEEQKEMCVKAGLQYEADSALPIWRAMALRQGGRWVARPTNSEQAEALPLGKMLYPGEAVDVELFKFIDDAPDKTVKEPGPWACVRMLHTFKADRSAEDGRLWNVGVRARDDAGRDRVVWLRLTFPRELPTLAAWPTARYAAAPVAGAGGATDAPPSFTDLADVPEEQRSAVGRGDEAMAARRYAEAARIYEDALRAKDSSPVKRRLAEARYRLHMQKSVAEERAGKLQRAIDEVGSAIAIRSTPAAAARRAALEKRLRFEKALAAARDLERAGKVAEARDAYRRVLATAPEAGRAPVREALKRLEGRLAEADADKTLAEVRAMLARGDFDEALARASWGAGKFAGTR
ncbi:MAG: type VI secretion protein IcmF/TssM N-terminal domain-containing protein, partial [Planctomycetota bacterium]